MSGEKYIGLDVHQATISVAVMNPNKEMALCQWIRTELRESIDLFSSMTLKQVLHPHL